MTQPLWTIAELQQATQGTTQGEWYQTVLGVSIDSRTVKAGDLFIALEGPKFDGHDFVADALQRNAAGVLVQRRPLNLPSSAPLLLTADTLQALIALGRFSRTRSPAMVTAVTGSVGKTGTKECLRAAFESIGNTHASAGSFNNHWGVPFSLATLPASAKYAIFELGMNHAGEIAELTRLVRPHIAIITTVAPAHIEFFPSLEAIADAKCEIFEGLEKGGTAILPSDHSLYSRMVTKAKATASKLLSFGERAGSDIRLIDYRPLPLGSEITADILGTQLHYRLSLPGRHWALNSLAVLGAVKASQGDLDKAASALFQVAPLKGRGERHDIVVDGKRILLVDESYNASPIAVKAAIAVLADIKKPTKNGRRILALGDMLELGTDGPALHAELAGDVKRNHIDLIFTAGPLMAALYENLPSAQQGAHNSSSAAMVKPLIDALQDGDVVLVKGSLGSRMKIVVDALCAAAQGTSPIGDPREATRHAV